MRLSFWRFSRGCRRGLASLQNQLSAFDVTSAALAFLRFIVLLAHSLLSERVKFSSAL
jgi:hypothetical protein